MNLLAWKSHRSNGQSLHKICSVQTKRNWKFLFCLCFCSGKWFLIPNSHFWCIFQTHGWNREVQHNSHIDENQIQGSTRGKWWINTKIDPRKSHCIEKEQRIGQLRHEHFTYYFRLGNFLIRFHLVNRRKKSIRLKMNWKILKICDKQLYHWWANERSQEKINDIHIHELTSSTCTGTSSVSLDNFMVSSLPFYL